MPLKNIQLHNSENAHHINYTNAISFVVDFEIGNHSVGLVTMIDDSHLQTHVILGCHGQGVIHHSV